MVTKQLLLSLKTHISNEISTHLVPMKTTLSNMDRKINYFYEYATMDKILKLLKFKYEIEFSGEYLPTRRLFTSHTNNEMMKQFFYYFGTQMEKVYKKLWNKYISLSTAISLCPDKIEFDMVGFGYKDTSKTHIDVTCKRSSSLKFIHEDSKDSEGKHIEVNVLLIMEATTAKIYFDEIILNLFQSSVPTLTLTEDVFQN
ncbi:unnamed protein product [Didymodactylos carnosus]|uniref:Uncharacterized protein n=1 Tax=Didymodactylos carnosus TaxID=1234261 RepID=A0A815VB54_9BILA|nr:unnamed protein product [Didymodactylos carnosus]CAF1527802.1 unnamed protein product [Didymodactylos carnosus]CAF4199197.1 unnamed protein product [Didymodactylos carnosus]CAF4386951.1 unnamed protein product [Didymodactylos carnosus]